MCAFQFLINFSLIWAGITRYSDWLRFRKPSLIPVKCSSIFSTAPRSVQEPNTALYPICTENSFLRSKTAWAWNWSLFFYLDPRLRLRVILSSLRGLHGVDTGKIISYLYLRYSFNSNSFLVVHLKYTCFLVILLISKLSFLTNEYDFRFKQMSLKFKLVTLSKLSLR
jgi:hypothetical protein